MNAKFKELKFGTSGIRILFNNGEISHLRPSGNAPEFRNYAIADSQDRAREIVRIGIEKVMPKLVEIASAYAKASADRSRSLQ